MRKTPYEKLLTKIHRTISSVEGLDFGDNKIIITEGSIELVKYEDDLLIYNIKRYYPTKVDKIKDDIFTVTIIINDENLAILGSNISNPPNICKNIIRWFQEGGAGDIINIIIGAEANKIENNILYITKYLFETIKSINQEEGKEKSIRIKNRLAPFLNHEYNIEYEEDYESRNYSTLIDEIIASESFSQADLEKLSSYINPGENINVVLENQIIQQVEWLINSIQEILDKESLTTASAKDLGNSIFGFTKKEIKGPEHLMEKILTKYGKNVLFGVPVLLNTDKYIIHAGGLSKCQFDIILINHLGDVEVVELKRSDKNLLEFDQSRCKFYASKDLSIAISQAERYLSEVYKDNDEEYKINNKKLKDFLHDEVGDILEIDICRPKAIIIMGSKKKIASHYDTLPVKTKRKITKQIYEKNCRQAYKELKDAHKNIHIITYSDLIETARTRLVVDEVIEE